MDGATKQQRRLKENGNGKKRYTKNKKMESLGNIIRKKSLENLILTRHIYGKKDSSL